MINIEYLFDYPEYAGNVSRWLYDEFVHPDNEDLEYKEFYEIFQNNSKSVFPIRLIALSDGKCVGTVTIIDNDFESRDYTPWLGGLYVDSMYRNCGIGRNLIEVIKQIARDLGYREIYLNTEKAGKYYKNLGWKYVETCPNDNGRMCEIYKYDWC